MRTWHEFGALRPELAGPGLDLLYAVGVGLGYLATTHPTEDRGVHPMCPVRHEAGLFAFIIPSPKQRDLRTGRPLRAALVPVRGQRGRVLVHRKGASVTDTGLRSELGAVFVAERVQFRGAAHHRRRTRVRVPGGDVPADPHDGARRHESLAPGRGGTYDVTR